MYELKVKDLHGCLSPTLAKNNTSKNSQMCNNTTGKETCGHTIWMMQGAKGAEVS